MANLKVKKNELCSKSEKAILKSGKNKSEKKSSKTRSKSEANNELDNSKIQFPGFTLEQHVNSITRDKEKPLFVSLDIDRNTIMEGNKLIVVLDGCCLELTSRKQRTGKTKEFSLLDGSKHKYEAKERNMDASDIRPDIVHKCLLLLQNSSLNKSGHMVILIKTVSKCLIQLAPGMIIPQRYDDFESLFINLLLKKTIKGRKSNKGTSITLMRHLKHDLDTTLPSRAYRVGLSVTGDPIKNLEEYMKKITAIQCDMDSSSGVVTKLHMKYPIVLAIGAVAKSDPVNETTWPDTEIISIADRGLTAYHCLTKVLYAVEKAWCVV